MLHLNRILLVILALTKVAFAALPATAVWDIRSTATAGNANGGFFNSASVGTDYSLQDVAQLSLTDLANVAASATVTSATGGFTAQMVGNGLHVISGTNFTPSWYEIVAYISTNSVTLDRAPATNGSVGVCKIGGALSFGSILDQTVFQLKIAGMKYYMKNGGYTFVQGVGAGGATGNINPYWFIGYNLTHGDLCIGNTRPLINVQNFDWNFGDYFIKNLRIFGANTTRIAIGGAYVDNCSFLQRSTSTTTWSYIAATNGIVSNCDFCAYRGVAAASGGDRNVFRNSVFHHSRNGLGLALGTQNAVVENNIIHSNYERAVSIDAQQLVRIIFQNNTLVGSINKVGVGFEFTLGNAGMLSTFRNIIYGFTTGVVSTTANTANIDDYNVYFNNTANVTNVANWQIGPKTVTIDPGFTGIGIHSGSTATTTSGDHLVQTGALFVHGSIPVVAGRDCVCIVSGTGVTAGYYGIASVDSDVQITTDIALTANATANKVWFITVGQDFTPGPTMKGLGGLVFPGQYTQGYADPGAVQQFGTGGGGDAVFAR